jgi:mono/diheme cytochrome c family protein
MSSAIRLEFAPQGRNWEAIVICKTATRACIVTMALALPTLTAFDAQAASKKTLERGKYLVTIASCTDCHTPGHFFGKPDMERFLGGSEVGFEIPELGVFHGPNLTPDKDTGLGNWTKAQIVTAITQGKRPDGRQLAPIMPWHAFASFKKRDVSALVDYLMSLKPVKNKVPGPFGPSEKPTAFVMKIVPGAGMPPPERK